MSADTGLTDLALSTDAAKATAVGLIVAVVVIGLIIGFVVTKIIAKLVTVIVVVALGALLWTQRTSIEDAAKKCDASFFGYHLTPSDPDVKRQCQNITNNN